MSPGLVVLLLCVAQSDDARREARLHFDAGREHHKLGDFGQAIAEYETAYRIAPLPDILFNIGQCHRNLKNQERAIFFFERFLDESPNTPDGDLVRKLIAELEQELAKERATAKTATVAAAPPPPPPPPAVVPPPIDPVESEGVHEKWWFWTIVAVGVAAAAAGGAYALTRNGDPEGTIGTIDLR